MTVTTDPSATVRGVDSRVGEASEAGAWATGRRGLQLSPELKTGLGLTLTLALVATAGRTVVPIAVQQTLDRGVAGASDSATATVGRALLLAGAALLVTLVASYFMNRRLVAAAERGLSTLRVKAFRHLHDLSVLTQDAERRGSLVARVTTDVDTISAFLQSGGLFLLVSAGQVVVATVVMAFYSWQLTLLIWLTFIPFLFFLRFARRRVAVAYGLVRVRVGAMLAVVGEAVLGARVVKAYGAQDRSARRISDAVEGHYSAALGAQKWLGASSGTGDLAWGSMNAVVVFAGVKLGLAGDITVGELLGFLFLVTLFVSPVQVGVEMLNQAQNAVAGWRRVLSVLDTPTDVADPARGVDLPPGRLDVALTAVGYAYPEGPPVLREVDVTLAAGTRVAIVGETGSGKTTFAKLLVRLMDPTAGVVALGGVDVRTVRFSSLRRRALLVPQEGFLLDATLRENLLFAAPEADDDRLRSTIAELGLGPWFDGLSSGLDTPVGQRGESLSAGERQLVALIGAALADPDLLVLDEATSAVDPATEITLQTALASLTRGRTSITIAHRLSTAIAADEVLVFDGGRIVERGRHVELVGQGGVYSGLHQAWAQSSGAPAASA